LVQVLVVLLAHVREAAGPDARKGQQGALLLRNKLRCLALALRTWTAPAVVPATRSPCGTHQCLQSCCLSLCHQNDIRVNYPPAGRIRLARGTGSPSEACLSPFFPSPLEGEGRVRGNPS